MKKAIPFILAGFICIMMIAAGCTSTPGTTPAGTTTTAATVAVTPSAPATVATTAIPATNLSWTGTWNTTFTELGNVYSEITVLKQVGTSVTGTGINGTYNDTLIGSVNGSRLTGTWSESNGKVTFNGTFEFVLSADKNSFTGTWANEGENLTISRETWNGVRV